MNTDSYTVARCFAAGGTLAAILAWPMAERYGTVAGVSWLLVALLGLFGAWYDQTVVRRSKERRRALRRYQAHPLTLVPSMSDLLYAEEGITIKHARSVVADLLIQEDHRRIRKGEQA